MEQSVGVLILWPVVLIGILLLFAGGLVTTVWFGMRRRRIAPDSAAFLGSGLVWGLPALAMMAGLTWLAIPHFKTGSIPPLSAETVALRDAPLRSVLPAEPIPVGEEPPVPAENLLPDWVHARQVQDGEATFLVLSSKQYATIEEAEAELAPAVADLVQHDFHRVYPWEGPWTIPASVTHGPADSHELAVEPDSARSASFLSRARSAIQIKLKGRPMERTISTAPPVMAGSAIRQRFEERVERDFGSMKGTMYRLHLQVALTPTLQSDLVAPWKEQIVQRRVMALGGLFGFLALTCAAIGGYFRMDAQTAGAFRNRLKFSAAAVIAAGSIATGWMLS